MKKVFTLITATAALALGGTGELNFDSTHSISPLIYGYNQDHEAVDGDNNFGSRRLGGNRMSTFNWEINVENSSEGTNSSWGHIKGILGVLWNDRYNAGEAYKHFHQENLDNGITSIITVPILGWVAADDQRTVTTGPHGADSLRWNQLIYQKGSPFSLQPDTTDRVVYLDESIHFLKETFGGADATDGVKYISLGNEPALWANTHELLQETNVGAEEYVDKTIAAAIAVKSVDPNVNVIVGEFAGINIYDLQSAPDWSAVKAGYDWFPDYLLDRMKKASDTLGYDLIDIFAFHNYPQHKIDASGDFSSGGTVVRTSTSTEAHIRKTRMDFARSMWDTTYIEPSWLSGSKLNNEPNKILKRLKASIATYYPGVKLMIGEFDYGHDTDISHGLALADLLGVIAQEGVEIANRWDLNTGNDGVYTNAAYQLYRNYDGNKSTYGNMAVPVSYDSPENGSVWASKDTTNNNLHIVVINKELTSSQDFTIGIDEMSHSYISHEVYGFDVNASAISKKSGIGNVTSSAVTIQVPALTALHIVIKREKDVPLTKSVQLSQKAPFSVKSSQLHFVEEVEAVTVSNIMGQTIMAKDAVKTNETVELAKGLYLVQYRDMHKREVKIKAVVK